MIYSTYDTHLRGTVRFTVIEMEMNWKNMQVSMEMQTNNRSRCSQVKTGKTVLQIWKIPRKATAMESHFITVTGLSVSLKQDSTTGHCVETFDTFKNRYFLRNTSRQLLLIVQTIFIVPSPSFLPYLYKWTRAREGLTSSGLYVGSPPG